MSSTRCQVVFVLERGEGLALAAAALVEQDDAIVAGVEEAAVLRVGAAAGAAVEEHDWFAGGVAGLLEVEVVLGVDGEASEVIGLDRRIEGAERVGGAVRDGVGGACDHGL